MMTNDEAARILDPETSLDALLPYAADDALRFAKVEEACRLGAAALRLPENSDKVAEVRHGRWIDCEDEYSSYVRCSVCGDEYTNWEADCAHTDFCPTGQKG